jgi:hypothetical protein
MVPRLCTITVLCLLAPFGLAAEDTTKRINGRVLDEAGRPVPGASVSGFWGANGLDWDQVVAVRDTKPEKLWQNEGKMEPWGQHRAVTAADGRFSIPAPDRKNALLVCDRERRHGAVIVFDPKHPEVTVEAGLQPLVRVFGAARLAGAEGPLKWSCVYLNTPYDENAPLLFRRMAICGSFETRFEFLVPPGTYEINASSDAPRAATVEDRTITVTGDQKELDLGALVLRPFVGLQERIDRAKAQGTWGNYKENFGKRPPRWHLTDAKGVAKDAEIADFRGKWVVLYFWSPGCVPCLGKQLPEMMAFYEAHRGQGDRFEILAFCCDFSATLKSIPELEKRLEPVKKAVWGGKDLPFPVLLDNTFQTYVWYGLEGSGVSNILLIDPEGKLVKGDLKTLAEKLDRLNEASR